MKKFSAGWHLVRALLFLVAGGAVFFLGGALMKSLAPDAATARFWVGVCWVLPVAALTWVALCHLLQPVIKVIGVHFISVALLIFWGGVLLYFYQSGRVTQYLPDDGLFRPLMLTGGIGMAVLGVFNLLVGKSKGDACCGHDHDHDHGHGHDHDHDHEHSHECGHDHGHVHTHDCGHDHGHDHAPAHTPAPAHTHEHGHECCGHDHDHDHSHAPAMAAHDHEDEHEEHAHSHCILSSPRWFNQSSAILVLLAPLALAAAYSPDQFSAKAVMNKNLYNPTYGVGARAEQFSLRTDDKGKIPAAKPAPARAPAVVDMPPPADNSSKVPGAPGPATAAAVAQTPATPPGAAKTQSYGSFTLADLEAQIPRNKNGNFELNVPEIYYTAGDAEVQKAIAGQTIETVAQVLPEKVNNANGHRLRVFRLLVQCCAADARPYSVPVDFGKKAPEIKDMTWVRVTGKLTYAKEGDQIVPIIQATGLEETTAPADAMIY